MNATLVGGAGVEFPMRPVQRLLAEIVVSWHLLFFSASLFQLYLSKTKLNYCNPILLSSRLLSSQRKENLSTFLMCTKVHTDLEPPSTPLKVRFVHLKKVGNCERSLAGLILLFTGRFQLMEDCCSRVFFLMYFKIPGV